MTRTLIARYSQIGDVLILLPAIFSMAKQYPEDEFTVLTNPKFSGIFRQMPPNITLYPMTYRKKNIPLRGLVHLFNRYSLLLKLFLSKKYDRVALLQNGTFDDQLQKLLSMRGSKVVKIDLRDFCSKEKLKKENYLTTPSLLDIVIQTFSDLGYENINAEFDNSFYTNQERLTPLLKVNSIRENVVLIGIAPFSRLKAKMYPLDRIEQIIEQYSRQENVQLLLFGGGEEERLKVETWKKKYPGIISLIDKLSFDEELMLIAACRVVLSMDSANMHLASLVKTPVVSVWGPSHPRLGYYPANQSEDNVIQRELECRPCSFFGENPCMNPNPYSCMDINPKIIIDKLNPFIK
jgi:ADP-heptose:LPS heptosyltransferase